MNCKVGDLAIIINAIHLENIGAIVEVIAAGEPTPEITLPYWHTRAVSGRAMKFTYHRSREVGWATDAFVYDWQLRALPPDEMSEAIEAQRPIEVES